MDVSTVVSIAKFIGINNVDKSYRLPLANSNEELGFPLQQANNVIIDNTYAIASRGGYTTSGITGTDIHSLWSDGYTALFVDGSSMYKMNYPVTAPILMRTGLQPHALMSYSPFVSKIYYSNGYQIGYLQNDTDHALADYSLTFKQTLPAGQIIDTFKSILLVAADDTVYIADPFCDYYDTRSGYKKFSQKIAMLRSLDNGVYISADKVYFMKGKSNESFELHEAYPSAAVPFTDVRVSAKFISEEMDGEVVIWTGADGICLGDDNGKVTNLTIDRYNFTARGRGAALMREKSNVRHYINALY